VGSEGDAGKEGSGNCGDGHAWSSECFYRFFVVASGTSDTQIEAIADSVDKEVWESGKIHVHAMEGKANREWILMDYYDVIVHVFLKDKRDFSSWRNYGVMPSLPTLLNNLIFFELI